MSGSPLALSLRRSAANLANTNCTAGILRSIPASFVKTGSDFEAYSACDIDDSREMKRCPALALLSNGGVPDLRKQIRPGLRER
jgi:hypothetical protein